MKPAITFNGKPITEDNTSYSTENNRVDFDRDGVWIVDTPSLKDNYDLSVPSDDQAEDGATD